MRRLNLVIAFLLAALPCIAQRAGPFNLSALNQCAPINVNPQTTSTVGINVTGTFSATLTPQVVIAGQSAVNTNVYPYGSSTAQGTITASGAFFSPVAGIDKFQVCVTGFTSGSATVYLNVSTASARGPGGGGGGGSGTVTHTAGALTAKQLMIGNGAADSTVDPDASTDGAGNETAVSYTSSGLNGGLIGPEGTCGSLTPATGIDLLCSSSGGGSGALATHGWVQNVNNAGWTTFASAAGSAGVLQASNGSGGLQTTSLTDNGTNVAGTEPFLSASGTASAPAYGYSSYSGLGRHAVAISTECFAGQGDTCDVASSDSSGQVVASTLQFGWSSSSSNASSGLDTSFTRQAAGYVGVSNGANPSGGSGSYSSALVANGGLGVVLTSTASITGPVPVKADTSNANQVVVTTTTDTGAGIVLGICANSAGTGLKCYVMTSGIFALTLDSGTCAIGNWVQVGTTTNGRVLCTGTYNAGKVIGVAMAAQSTVGSTFNVMVGIR